MTDRLHKLEADRLFIATEGCYDDYRVIGLFITRTEIDEKEDWKAYAAEYPHLANCEWYEGYHGFLRWLVEKGKLQQLSMASWSLSSDCGEYHSFISSEHFSPIKGFSLSNEEARCRRDAEQDVA